MLAAGQFFLLTNAHVEMKSPIPFRSQYLPNPGPDTDYSMTSPLNQDGSNFPCKGYQNDTLAPTATLTAGSSFLLEYLFSIRFIMREANVVQVIWECNT